MPGFKIDKAAISEYAAVPNAFIEAFMRDADGDEVKVFLYLVYAASVGLPVSLPSVAEACGITEKKVRSALSHWEKESLLTLYYENNDLAGVKFASASAALVSREKHQTTRDRMRQILAANKDAEQLIFIASEYFGRPLTASESRTLLFFYDNLSFPFALCEYLLEYSAAHGAKDMRYVEAAGLGWHEEGIRTLSQAKTRHPAKPNEPSSEKEEKKVKKPAGKNKSYAQHDYDFREQEKLIKEKMFRK